MKVIPSLLMLLILTIQPSMCYNTSTHQFIIHDLDEPPIEYHNPVDDVQVRAQMHSVMTGLFKQNCGQVNNTNVLFYCISDTMNIALERDGILIQIMNPAPNNQSISHRRSGHQVKVLFFNSNDIIPIGREESQGVSNYIFGDNHSYIGVHDYRKIIYENVWDGVDIEYQIRDGRLKYNIIVNPYARIEDIKFKVEGHEDLRVSEDGSLEIQYAAHGILFDTGLDVYFMDNATEKLDAMFHVNRGIYSFIVHGRDSSRTVVIDPLIYSTYVGGSYWDSFSKIQVDVNGCAYAVGSSQGANFPTTVGAFDTSTPFSGPYDVVVTKMNQNGSALVFSTYIGGGGLDDTGSDIWVDNAGYVYIVGKFSCGAFGTYPTTVGAFDTTCNGAAYTYDAFVTKLNYTGSSLVYSTYLGGTYEDNCRGIYVDSSSCAYVCGATESTNFPMTAGTYDATQNGGYDGYIAKLSSDGKVLLSSTYLGGGSDDALFGVGINAAGVVIAAGNTLSTNFPTTAGAMSSTYQGDYDCTITKFNITCQSIVYSSYLGGNFYDVGVHITVSDTGDVILVGNTKSADFPVTSGAYDETFNSASSSYDDGFILKMNESSDIVFSTFYGGSNNDVLSDVIEDGDGNIYACGYTTSFNLPLTPDALDRTCSNYEALLMKLSPNGESLLYSTFLGGTNDDRCFGLSRDNDNFVYCCGNTHSQDFPTTTGCFDNTFNSASTTNADCFMVKVSAHSIHHLQIRDAPHGGGNILSNLTMAVNETIDGYVSFYNETSIYIGAMDVTWSVTNDTFSTANSSPTIGTSSTLNSGINGGSAIWTASFGNVTNSSYININPPGVDEIQIMMQPGNAGGQVLDMIIGPNGSISGYSAAYNNSIGYVADYPTNWTLTNYDGATAWLEPCGNSSIFHVGNDTGYALWIASYSNGSCWKNDTVNITCDLTNPIADAGSNQTKPIGANVVFDGSGSTDPSGVSNFSWTFTYGGPVVLYGVSPNYSFNDMGFYEVTLKVTDTVGNWALDAMIVSIIDATAPTAIAGPDQYVGEGTQVALNGSASTDNIGILNYNWSFVDGVQVLLNGVTASYQFNVVGTYYVTLRVYDTSGNWDVDILIVYVLDSTSPNANAGPDRNVDEDAPVTLNGGNSTDNIGIVNYTWTLFDAVQVSMYGITPTYTFYNPGHFSVTLNVSDGEGNWDTDTIAMTVNDITSPVADAGNNETITDGSTFIFDGRASTDNVGIAEYYWSFVDYDPIVLSGARPSYTFSNVGVYCVTLNVSDAAGNVDTDIMTITVLDATIPTADAGPNQIVDDGTIVTFNGSNSIDNVGVVNYTWTFIDGMNTTLNGINPSHQFKNPGTYQVSLYVADAAGNQDTDAMTVTVRDITSPVADAGPDKSVGEDVQVRLDGANSTDNVGIVNYTWIISGVTSSVIGGVSIAHTFVNPGYYIVVLNVTDAAGNWGTDTAAFTVMDTTVPIADAGIDQIVYQNTHVILNGSGSSDNVGIVNYTWLLTGNGTTISMYGMSLTYNFSTPGSYSVALSVRDAAGNSASDIVMVDVTPITPLDTDDSNDCMVWLLIIIVIGTLTLLWWIKKYIRKKRQ